MVSRPPALVLVQLPEARMPLELPETLQLMASYDTVKGISDQLRKITAAEHRIKIVYEVSTVGGSGPMGAPGLPAAVPVSSSQVSGR